MNDPKEGAKFVEKSSGELFVLSYGRRLNAENEMALVYHLRNAQHFHEVDKDQLKKNFVRF
jgi:hypothetical protein